MSQFGQLVWNVIELNGAILTVFRISVDVDLQHRDDGDDAPHRWRHCTGINAIKR